MTLIQNYHYLLFKYNTNFGLPNFLRKTKKYSYQLSFSYDWEREAVTVESINFYRLPIIVNYQFSATIC